MFLTGYIGFQQFHYLKIKKSNLISNGSVQTIVLWFREKRFSQKKFNWWNISLSFKEWNLECHSWSGSLKKIQTSSYLEIRSNYWLYSSRLEVEQLQCYINYKALKLAPIWIYNLNYDLSKMVQLDSFKHWNLCNVWVSQQEVFGSGFWFRFTRLLVQKLPRTYHCGLN
jgi:hypothetical protein